MKLYEVNESGICSTCNGEGNDTNCLKCYECKSFFHAICGSQTPFANKSFVKEFLKKGKNFIFLCDYCLTLREQENASDIKQQMSQLNQTVSKLAREFSEFKSNQNMSENRVQTTASCTKEISQSIQNTLLSDKKSDEISCNEKETSQTSNAEKFTICIKSNDNPINADQVRNIVIENSIPVIRTNSKPNGDLFIELPSLESKNKLEPLLKVDPIFKENNVVNLKSKSPTIAILDIDSFTSKEDFESQVKNQNPHIKELCEKGSEFSVIFAKEPKEDGKFKTYHVVARVSDDIRKILEQNRNRIFLGMSSHRVIDRFYIKRCNNCLQYGHYEKDCKLDACCGYCRGKHLSKNCDKIEQGDFTNYECHNCQQSGKCHTGHSAMWTKCPTYIEAQAQMKKSIPFYQKNA